MLITTTEKKLPNFKKIIYSNAYWLDLNLLASQVLHDKYKTYVFNIITL